MPADQNMALVIMGAPSRLAVRFSLGVPGIREFLAGSGPSSNGTPSVSSIRLADNQELADDGFRDSDVPNQSIERIGPKQELNLGSDSGAERASKHRQRTELLLTTFSMLADWLGHYPGRKSVYWISEGFPHLVENTAIVGASQLGRREGLFGKQQREVDKLLQNARIAVYPIDINGVQVDRPTVEEWDRVSDLQDFADQTGGVFRRNDNDIAGILHEEFDRNQDSIP